MFFKLEKYCYYLDGYDMSEVYKIEFIKVIVIIVESLVDKVFGFDFIYCIYL